MALSKEQVVDMVEVTEGNAVQVRVATRILEDGEIISQSFHRYVVMPGDDYSDKPERVKQICDVVHTQEVIAAYQAQQEAQRVGE